MYAVMFYVTLNKRKRLGDCVTFLGRHYAARRRYTVTREAYRAHGLYLAVLCTACSWKLSVLFASAFMQAANVFLQVHNAFLQAINTFMQPVNVFLQVHNASLQAINTFMQAANVFLQVHNAFLQAINTFMQAVNVFMCAA